MARWNSCNLLHLAPDAKRLWQFDAKGGDFALGREQRVPYAETLPKKGIAKNWTSLWQPKLNVAWLPPESAFLRVVELPAANAEETFAMVELQLEKLSPLPPTQIVWTMHVLGTHQSVAKADGTTESLQTVVAVIVERAAVEEFLGKLERDGFFADRLEAPMLDQLATIAPDHDGTWVFPLTLGGQNAALIAWFFGGALRSLNYVTLPPAGDRAAELKNQLAHQAWSGELEGWLVTPPKWHLVADPVNAAEWENLLRTGLGEPVEITAPPALPELAAATARRASLAGKSHLLPEEFAARYKQRFEDRLWLHGLGAAGLAYAAGLVIYFCAVAVLGYRTHAVESQVAAISGSYTNAMQLQAQYRILQQRAQLKYAALDCWQLVAEKLPPDIKLQRLSFSDGQKLALSGTAPADAVNTLFDFNTALQKAKLNGQPFFDPAKGETVNPQMRGDTEYWNLSLDLLHPEGESR